MQGLLIKNKFEEDIMGSLLTNLETIIPTFMAVMALVMFKPKTRRLCYLTIVLAITSELIPITINTTALLATISCFIGLLVAEYLHTHNTERRLAIRH